MLKFIHIAAGGNVEGWFWILTFIVWIIFQMTKAAKKMTKTTLKQNTAKPYVAPEDDIRKFLEGLGVQTGGKPPRPPAHVQQAHPKHVSAARHTRAPRQQARNAPPPVPPVMQTRSASRPFRMKPLAASVPQTHDIEDHHSKAYEIGRVHHLELNEIISDLENDDTVRKAILLREILGPPIALR